jgi:AAA ATPase domain
VLRQEDVRSLVPRPLRESNGAASARSVRLLGRTHELETLDRAARAALDGSFGLVLVEGEAGVGKTRLLDELAASLAGVRVGRATCSELERHLPYVPLANTIRDALGDSANEVPHRPALENVLPELAVGEPHVYSEVDVLEALAKLIAEHAPVALFLDDLQWADQATIAALSYLQRRCAGSAALVVAALRSEETPPDHPARRLTTSTFVQLEPLTPADLAPLGMPELHASTGGNPRFVAAAVASKGSGELSSTLAEAIIAQCRAEGAWAYRVLVTAAVLEQPFQPEPLAVLLEVDIAELLETLEHLCERRILRVDGLSFRFRYSLVREVLVASLSPARHRLLRERLDLTRFELGPQLTADRPAR